MSKNLRIRGGEKFTSPIDAEVSANLVAKCDICEGSPAPRVPRSVATPTRSGASNLDAIIDEGTLTIGWVGPALLGILIAAFGWAGRVFEWLGTLATWLFSGEWRDYFQCSELSRLS